MTYLVVKLRELSLSHVDIHLRVLHLDLPRLLVLVVVVVVIVVIVVNHPIILRFQYRIVF